MAATAADRASVLLPRGLADPDAGVRARAVRVAQALGATKGAPQVARRLADGEVEVRREAAGALARIAMPSAEIATAILEALVAPARPAEAAWREGDLEALGDALERAVRAEDASRLGQALQAVRGAERA